MFTQQDQRLVYEYDAEQLWIEPWGLNAFRIRATKQAVMPTEQWALTQKVEPQNNVVVDIGDRESSIINGKIKAVITAAGKLLITTK